MKIFSLLAILTFSWAVCSQTMTVKLVHEYDGQAFAYNTDYEGWDGKMVRFTRIQYYLGNFDIIHDGGQVHSPMDSWIIASANVSDYSFEVETTISNVEAVNFEFGVDAATNDLGITTWPEGHPLSLQSPNMDWGWPEGYKFFAFEGLVDSDDDGVPDEVFHLHGVGDHLLKYVTVESLPTSEIQLFVNVADWFEGIDLSTIGIMHGTTAEIADVSSNTLAYSVFESSSVLGNEFLKLDESVLYVDCGMEYAPTIYYDLLTELPVHLRIHDLSGNLVLEKGDLSPEGNFFVRKELETGVYIATFHNSELRETVKFSVVN